MSVAALFGMLLTCVAGFGWWSLRRATNLLSAGEPERQAAFRQSALSMLEPGMSGEPEMAAQLPRSLNTQPPLRDDLSPVGAPFASDGFGRSAPTPTERPVANLRSPAVMPTVSVAQILPTLSARLQETAVQVQRIAGATGQPGDPQAQAQAVQLLIMDLLADPTLTALNALANNYASPAATP